MAQRLGPSLWAPQDQALLNSSEWCAISKLFPTPAPLQVASTVHSLRLFFLGAFERGELSGGRASEPAPVAQQQQSPEAVFSAWLLRQYSAYVSALLALLTSGPDARTQVRGAW